MIRLSILALTCVVVGCALATPDMMEKGKLNVKPDGPLVPGPGQMILYDIGVELGRRELVSSDVERVDAAVVETVFLGTSVESWALSDPIFRGRATVAVVSGGDRVEVDVGGIGVEVKVSDIVRAANVAAMPIVQSEQYRMEGWEAFGYIHILSLLSKDGTWELALQHGAY